MVLTDSERTQVAQIYRAKHNPDTLCATLAALLAAGTALIIEEALR
jgi:hypothetical protein